MRVKIGTQTGWRYTGVMGEMRKLGITDGLRFTARWGPPEFVAAWLKRLATHIRFLTP